MRVLYAARLQMWHLLWNAVLWLGNRALILVHDVLNWLRSLGRFLVTLLLIAVRLCTCSLQCVVA